MEKRPTYWLDDSDITLLRDLIQVAVGLAFWGAVICVLILLTNTPADWAAALREHLDSWGSAAPSS